MSSEKGTGPRVRESTASRRFGYLLAIAVNGLVLYVVHHQLEWGWPRFVTQDFAEILPILSVSIVAAMVVNVFFVLYDAPWFQSLCNAVTSAIAMTVAIRTYQVFPFDFSSYSTDWSWLARVITVLAIVGTGIAVVVNVVKFIGSVAGGIASRAG